MAMFFCLLLTITSFPGALCCGLVQIFVHLCEQNNPSIEIVDLRFKYFSKKGHGDNEVMKGLCL
jgi:hypothetical protein